MATVRTAAKVETMTNRDLTPVKTAHVVERAPLAALSACRRTNPSTCGYLCSVLMCLLLTLIVALVPFAPAWADDGTDGSGDAQITVTDSITNTENLLGGNLTDVTDAINATKDRTGVSVKLLYLPSFRQGVDPEEWASQTLESSDPAANTVMLAVATQDGILVVAVSANSEEWLRKQSTVDELSQAALGPIVSDGSNPDWPGSAKAMMDAIARIKESSTSTAATGIGIAVFGIALGLVVIVSVAFFLIRRRRKARHSGGRRNTLGVSRSQRRSRGKSTPRRKRTRGGASPERSEKSTDTSDDIQETSSEEVQSGNHEQTN